MRPIATKIFAALAAAFLLAACSEKEAGSPNQDDATKLTSFDCSVGKSQPALGLMTSLPLYWDIETGIEQFAQGNGEPTWQRTAISQCYSIVPLDTLSPIAGLSPEEPETDPLSNLELLAVVQPRGLAPSDNVALDKWVRDGGRLLLVLDPMLTGDYHLPIGDPRRPTDTALIPPVVERWGLTISYDDEQEPALREAQLSDGHVWLSLHGTIALNNPSQGECALFVNRSIARCAVGEGSVTLIADAASFEHALDEVENTKATKPPMISVMDFAFSHDRIGEARD